MAIRVVLSLGSNLSNSLGDREQLLRQAVAGILSHATLMNTTAIYETSPWPVETNPSSPQPWYLNVSIEVATDLTVEDFHRHCQQLEIALGREAKEWREINAPRPIDIDLLWATDSTGQTIQSNTAQLTLPHPRFHLRRCTLIPLLEDYADWPHPASNLTLADAYRQLNNTGDTSEVNLHSWPSWAN